MIRNFIRVFGAFAFLTIVSPFNQAFADQLFGVSTSAKGGGQGAGASASYNTRDGGSFGDSKNPSNPSISNPTDSFSGTNTPGQTSAFSQTTQSAQAGSVPVTSSDYAAASLATGSLHASASSSPVYDSFASTQLFDTLTFHVAGATDSTVTTLHILFSVDGMTNVLNQSRDATLQLGTGFAGNNNPTPGFGNPNAVNWAWSGGQNTGSISDPNSFVSWKVLNYSQTGLSVDGTVTLTGTDPVLGLNAALDVSAVGFFDINGNPVTATQDYSNTAAISFVLPDGVTFTSASGDFLSDNAVPEPSSGLLAGAGAIFAVAYRLTMRRKTK